MERAHRNRRAVIGTQAKAHVAIILLACCPCTFALNPSLDINQYAHKAWTVREGFFKSIITSIAQTPDGYLWLGTELGLLRFDGVRAAVWMPPSPERLPSSSIYRLLASRDGTLWIGTDEGLASWNGKKLNHYPQLDRYRVHELFQDHEGTVWVGGLGYPSGRLCAIRGGSVQIYGEDRSFGRAVLSIHEIRGDLWLSAETGIWRWKPGSSKLYPMSASGRDFDEGLNEITGHLLISTTRGIRELVDGEIRPYPIPGPRQQFRFKQLLRDRDGVLWIGTSDQGLIHVRGGRTDLFSSSRGLSGESINTLFEDREGNIWVATDGGLDRFREFAVSMVSANQGLSSDSTWSVLAARDRSVWVGTHNGLNRWTNGKITIRKTNGLPDDAPQSLFHDDAGRIWLFTNHELGYLQGGVFVPASGVTGEQVHAIAGDSAKNLWLSEDRNLLHVTAGSMVEQIPWSRFGAEEFAWVLLPGGEPSGLWLGFRRDRGVIYFKDGQIRQSYSAADGLGEGGVGALKLDLDGSLWAATAGGLSVIKDGHVSTLTAKKGLPCDNVHWVMDDDNGSTWLYLSCGLARLNRAELDAWRTDPKRAVHPIIFDSSDGLTARSNLASGYNPRVTKAPDGRFWFLTGTGVSVFDPRHLPSNKLLPPVHVEEVKVDGKDWDASRGWHLPALTRDLEIHYTALSLVAPEKNRFKYKLEGRDSDWKDAGNERQASYTDLPPRHYRFRVIASNNSGVWNETGDSLDFSIAPAYYQTTWFQASCVAAFLGLIWALYRYRVHQVAREFNVRLEERVGERVRIARELHDTLLQTVQGLMLRLQVVDEMLPPGKAKEELEETLEVGDQAILEGRSTVRDLRSPLATNDLAQAVRALGDELASGSSTTFRLVVEGAARELHPIVRDEYYRIAREALRNAFAHAGAKQIEAEITYEDRLLRLRIRDDGQGMPAEILDEGRSGHFGLAGMRERAKQLGSKLTIWSGGGAGTEIDVSVAGSVAYAKPSAGSRFWRWGRKKVG